MSAKRVGVMVAILAGAAAVKVGLNVVLIPRLGIIGAGVELLATFVVTKVVLLFAGQRLLAHLIRGVGKAPA